MNLDDVARIVGRPTTGGPVPQADVGVETYPPGLWWRPAHCSLRDVQLPPSLGRAAALSHNRRRGQLRALGT
jgi:hypothetical protein